MGETADGETVGETPGNAQFDQLELDLIPCAQKQRRVLSALRTGWKIATLEGGTASRPAPKICVAVTPSGGGIGSSTSSSSTSPAMLPSLSSISSAVTDSSAGVDIEVGRLAISARTTGVVSE